MTRDELEKKAMLILYKHWDPIGINHYPQVEDEYVRYSTPAVYMLIAGARREMVVQMLDEAAMSQISRIRSAEPERTNRSVDFLIELVIRYLEGRARGSKYVFDTETDRVTPNHFKRKSVVRPVKSTDGS